MRHGSEEPAFLGPEWRGVGAFEGGHHMPPLSGSNLTHLKGCAWVLTVQQQANVGSAL